MSGRGVTKDDIGKSRDGGPYIKELLSHLKEHKMYVSNAPC